jgi:hypothetical protein
VRWWLAVPVAVAISIAGATADLRMEGALRRVFAVAYAVGCLAAVLGVPPSRVTMCAPPRSWTRAASAGTAVPVLVTP